VGRAVCDRALAFGLTVRGTYRSQSSQALVPPGVERILVPSIDGGTDWSSALAGVDTVIHLAACVHVLRDLDSDDLEVYRKTNTVATERLARMAAIAGVRRFVYISTIKVNGEETTTTPFTETDAPQPQDAYAISKWESEQILRTIEAKTGLEIVILRPPLVYGKGVGANFGRLIRLVERGIPLPLKSVANRRSLIFVKNLADAILSSASHPKAAGQTFLLSDGEDISTSELIHRIGIAMELPVKMFWFPSNLFTFGARIVGKSAELKRLFGSLLVDSTKFHSETAWVPPYTLSQGLKETIEWYLANRMSPAKATAAEGVVQPIGSSKR
jgi:nucleoside-diphosphate-sugar epimerase